MMIKIAACLLTLGFFAACQSTTTTAKRETLREMQSRYATNTSPGDVNGLSPVAEGPEEVPSNQSNDPNQNPALVPTPLMRTSAMGGL